MALMLPGALARAELSCEQLGVIAQATVAMRDQGTALSTVLADAERGDMKSRFTPQELDFIKRVIRASFERSVSPHEIVEACREGRLAMPQP